jgi:hypothetical protein
MINSLDEALFKVLRFSPCYGIGGGFGEIRKGQKPVRYELVKRIAVSTPPLYHNGLRISEGFKNNEGYDGKI